MTLYIFKKLFQYIKLHEQTEKLHDSSESTKRNIMSFLTFGFSYIHDDSDV